MDEMKKEMKIKITDDILKGVYSNSMMVTHTKEEFVLDFLNNFPPEGIVTARIVTSPGHLKRIIEALKDNLSKYESIYGEVKEAPDPSQRPGIQ